MKTYHPKPLNTEAIELPEALASLTEELAENTHDNWAQLRLEQGWVWGKNRDDGAKTHPDLVPYGELSESEKEYDRRTVIETLKAITVLGYTISKSTNKN